MKWLLIQEDCAESHEEGFQWIMNSTVHFHHENCISLCFSAINLIIPWCHASKVKVQLTKLKYKSQNFETCTILWCHMSKVKVQLTKLKYKSQLFETCTLTLRLVL